MNKIEKIRFLQDNHFTEWLQMRGAVRSGISNSQMLTCVCGRLATGLHESQCRKLETLITNRTVRKLQHLITK